MYYTFGLINSKTPNPIFVANSLKMSLPVAQGTIISSDSHSGGRDFFTFLIKIKQRSYNRNHEVTIGYFLGLSASPDGH